ncbi:hypothetical protein [Sanguibacter sp. Z1732]|uniref:hypothetical protein n=1 Tax=Sanguibacter sp. Z1732 TaxID=3435412 RepID=UPI003D9CA525
MNLGRVQGMAQSATITAAAIAPMIPAVSVALTGSHTAGLLALALIAVMASAVAWSLRDPTMVH